jgi:hypothetical protein
LSRMSLQFGIYTTIVGLAAVLVTLSAVIASCRILRRLLTRGAEAPRTGMGEALKLAAAVSAIQYILAGETPTPKMIAPETSTWPVFARLDSLRTSREDET